MRTSTSCLAFAIWLVAIGLTSADSIQGVYLEARSASVSLPSVGSGSSSAPWQAVLVWQVRKGSHQGVDLAGRTILAVVTIEPLAGREAPRLKTVLAVDDRASPAQTLVLVAMAKKLAAEVIQGECPVVAAKMDVRLGEGCARGHAIVDCGLVKVRTRSWQESDGDRQVAASNADRPMAEVYLSYPAYTETFASDVQPVVVSENLASSITGSFSW